MKLDTFFTVTALAPSNTKRAMSARTACLLMTFDPSELPAGDFLSRVRSGVLAPAIVARKKTKPHEL